VTIKEKMVHALILVVERAFSIALLSAFDKIVFFLILKLALFIQHKWSQPNRDPLNQITNSGRGSV
jgi:hypothetical protein